MAAHRFWDRFDETLAKGGTIDVVAFAAAARIDRQSSFTAELRGAADANVALSVRLRRQ